MAKMMKASELRTVNQIWKGYLDKVVPKDASEDQIKETKRAFFAGGHAIFQIMVFTIPILTDREAEKALTSLEKQFDGFQIAVQEGAA